MAQATLNTVSGLEHSPEGRTEYAVACSQVLHARICSPLQPRNRPAAYIVGSPNLRKRLVAMIAALNRVALLMIGEFRPPPHLHTPRLGALSTIARAANRSETVCFDKSISLAMVIPRRSCRATSRTSRYDPTADLHFVCRSGL